MDLSFLNDFVSGLINSYGLFGIFLVMFTETVIPIIPSSAILPFAGYSVFTSGRHILELLMVSVIATSGSTLGSVVLYLIARRLGDIHLLDLVNIFFLMNQN